jgi:hypothetical protein
MALPEHIGICGKGKSMKDNFDLQEYLSKGIERFVADVVKATLKNPRESAFMLKFATASATASQKRKAAEA